MDPAFPQERLAFMLSDAGIKLVLTQSRLASRLPADGTQSIYLDEFDWTKAEDAPVEAAVGPENLAYVMYTSGSTGRPKGVGVEHRNVAALIAWAHQSFPPADLESVLAVTSVCFDLSVFELFVPLATGGRVVLVEDTLAAASAP